jgi:type II secretory pathway pseudopilin PulG
MGRKITSVLAICMLAGSVLVAQDSATNKPPKKVSAEKLQQLQQQLDQQRKQLQEQQEAITALQQQVEQAQTEARTPQLVNASMQTAPVAKKQEVEAPLSIRYKGLNLVPGGFVEANFITRTRNQQADVASFPNGAPFGGNTAAKLTEFRASTRSTRFWLLGTGNAGSTKITGYGEIDFFGGGLANQVTTNSYTPRMRQLFGQADFKNGMTLTAGQTWSLLTTNRKGIATRAELIPNVMDAMYVIGWQYARQVGLRVTKNFNNKVWAAFAVEAPETGTVVGAAPSGLTVSGLSAPMFVYGATASGCSVTVPGVTGATCTFTATGANTSSNNYFPDVIAKVAFEPGFGHYEVSALGRFFRDRVDATGTPGKNIHTQGGGLKVAALLPVVAKKADFIFQAMGGNGLGRYGDLGAVDVVIKNNPGNPADPTNGALVPVRTYYAMTGLETHPNKKVDLYLYGGASYYGRTTWRNANGTFAKNGLGSPAVDNSACYSLGGCTTAQNKSSQQLTAIGYYKLFSGNFGTFMYALQYNYIHRNTWSGNNNGAALAVPGGPTAPKGFDSIVMTGFRYFLP